MQPANRTNRVAAGKARTGLLARSLDVGCPEVLHERLSYTVPHEEDPCPEWFI